MKLTAAKCPNCGGVLEIDGESKAAICEFCHSPFITEEAIQNYNVTVVNNNTTINNNTTVNRTVNNISGSEVHIHQNENSPERLLENIKALIERQNVRVAYELLDKLQRDFPTDYRADEAELLLASTQVSMKDNYIANRIRAIDIMCPLGRMKTAAPEVYQKYYDKLLRETNEKLSKKCNRNFTGSMLCAKMAFGTFDLLIEQTVGYNLEQLMNFDRSFYQYHIEGLFQQLDEATAWLRTNKYEVEISFKKYTYTELDTDIDYLIYLHNAANAHKIKINNDKKYPYDVKMICNKHLDDFLDAVKGRLTPEARG